MGNKKRKFPNSFQHKKKNRYFVADHMDKFHSFVMDLSALVSSTISFDLCLFSCVVVFCHKGLETCTKRLILMKLIYLKSALKCHSFDSSRRRPLKGTLYISGDGLRVVDDESKGLLVDQTIEKVSFCAPDRYHERGFSYICRDGTTRRWMCHGFLATKDSGERLSHAVGCAFAVCLERKQKRERDSQVSLKIYKMDSNFAHLGDHHATSLFIRKKLANRIIPPSQGIKLTLTVETYPPPMSKNVVNPHAIARPHAAPHLLARQGSIRGLTFNFQISPFKRQMSLRVSELPSTVERQLRSMSLDAPEFKSPLTTPENPDSICPSSSSVHDLSTGLLVLWTEDTYLGLRAQKPSLWSSNHTY
nr:EOG090X09VR [Artemia franciscana]